MIERIGIIGLGQMGRAVAWKLLAEGVPLNLFNRTRSKAEELLDEDVTLADSPQELAESCDAIISFVSDDQAMNSLAFESDGFSSSLINGKLLIEMSTLSEEMIEKVHKSISENGGRMLHAPVLGGPSEIENGSATICVGGDETSLQEVLPVLEKISSHVYFLGSVTQGTLMKMALNIMLAHLLTGISSSLAFANKTGLPQELVHDILSRVSGKVVARIGGKILNNDRSVTFRMSNLEKDQIYFLQAASKRGLELPTLSAAQRLFKSAVDEGMGEEDFTSVYRYIVGNWVH